MATTLHLPPKLSETTGSSILKTGVQLRDGLPVFHVNGRPHHGFFSSAPAKYMKNVLDAGFDIVDTHPQTSTGWVGPDAYDYTETDRRTESYLRQSGDALLIVRFWMGYPNEEGSREPFWWAPAHPEECVQPLDVPEGQSMPWDAVGNAGSWGQLIASSVGNTSPAATKNKHPARPSFASLRFREEAGEALFRVIRHIEKKYGDRIAGYVIGGGPCGEWFHWNADEAAMMDDGPTMRNHFRSWLERHYGDIEKLNEAWGTDLDSFVDAVPPTPGERFTPSFGNLRSSLRERKVLDFYDAFHQAVADTLLHWVARAKEGCDRNKAMMVFYGYLWNHNYGDSQARSGHAHLETVLRSPDVDVLVAPFCYSLRQLEGVITGQSLAASARLHGKLYLHELDGSTSLKPCWNCPDHSNPETPEQTGALFRRELNKMLCEGSAGWYMDLRGGYFDSAEVIAELRRTLEYGIQARSLAGCPDAQVAVVLDPRTPFYFREGEPLLSPLIDAFKQQSLAKMGLGFDDLTLDDLASLSAEQTERYRFWIFPAAVHLTHEQLGNIRRHACRRGNYVLWNYAVNVGRGSESPDLAGMEEATGFRCGFTREPGELSIRVEPGSHSLLKGLERSLVYGTRGALSPDEIKYHAILRLYATTEQGFSISPRFYIQEGGEVLGRLQDLSGQPVGWAIREMEGWTSILSCAPLLPPLFLRRLAEQAGCHVFTDFPGQVVQSENLIGLYAHADGECLIRLPRQSPVVKECYTDRILGRSIDSLCLPVKKNEAYLIHF